MNLLNTLRIPFTTKELPEYGLGSRLTFAKIPYSGFRLFRGEYSRGFWGSKQDAAILSSAKVIKLSYGADTWDQRSFSAS